jgi:hypothetical protein
MDLSTNRGPGEGVTNSRDGDAMPLNVPTAVVQPNLPGRDELGRRQRHRALDDEGYQKEFRREQFAEFVHAW